MAPSEARTVYDSLSKHHDGKAGYVIYRCTYGDDELWTRFVARMTAHINNSLSRSDVDGDQLLRDCWAWDVRDDEAKLNGATKEEVCWMFNRWARSVNGSLALTKYIACIYADAEVVESIMSGFDPLTTQCPEPADPKPYVKVLDFKLAGASVRDDAWDISEDELAKEDGGEPPVEGCTSWDVGWQKIGVRSLFPRAYNMMMSGGWEGYYERPPAINEE